MNWKSFLGGVAIGITIGILACKTVEQGKLSSDEVLTKVKNELKNNGKITGSWIIAIPETLRKNDLEYQVYRGGITRVIDGITDSFEFLADIKTGTILELEKLHSS